MSSDGESAVRVRGPFGCDGLLPQAIAATSPLPISGRLFDQSGSRSLMLITTVPALFFPRVVVPRQRQAIAGATPSLA